MILSFLVQAGAYEAMIAEANFIFKAPLSRDSQLWEFRFIEAHQAGREIVLLSLG